MRVTLHHLRLPHPPLVQSPAMESARDEAGVSIIARPLARDKLLKKTLKLVKRAARGKRLRRGVREVQKGIRKRQRGLVVIAGDISPVDVVSHFAAVCEESQVPYVYVPSKHELGAAGSTKRATSVVMVCPGEDWEHADDYDSLAQKYLAAAADFVASSSATAESYASS